MRVMLIGQKWLGLEVLRMCIDEGHDVAAVSAPRSDDRLAALANELGVPVCQVPTALGPEWVPDGVDVLVCAHAHVFVTAQARAKARHGALGYHPSLLPRHRGRDAIVWTLHMRDQVAGGTVYWMDDGADTGPIALQDWCWVRPGDDARSLWERDLGPMGVRLLRDALRQLDQGRLQRHEQDPALASWEPSYAVGKRLKG